MADENGTPIDDIMTKLVDEFIKFLEKEFADEGAYQAIKHLIPSLVDLAKAEGIDGVEEVVRGLLSEESYEYWRTLLLVSSYDNRILIMETQRQRAIEVCLQKIQSDERTKEWFRIGLRLLLSVLPVLLA